MESLKTIVETTYKNINKMDAETIHPAHQSAVLEVIELLNQGKLRVAEKKHNQWFVHTWVKEAILLFFRLSKNAHIDAGYTHYFDKIPLKFSHYTKKQFEEQGLRIVPNASVRQGAYIAKNTILMPSFVNIGAYVDEGSLIDTWATVGSCAQIGKNVHVSGGVGIGGVLEPLQAKPTIIEDHCFIGARSEIVEGVIVKENSVIGMGVFIGRSTPIYNRTTDEITYGQVPAGSVVLAGSLPSKTGKCQLNCAVIIKQIDSRIRANVAINELLRAY
ncbi:2,3,4,5-tetrahydropyridine-2,6-dicarboxylate N-succinyltransferase [Rickettsiella grylli]|uniref:2,3,4,5-tetrahydropyridine-2,6-dicarboxylate N-succinyltransferase n=1 Tax=Rickettsiella grylli TaxID=59196 RepID=A8PNU2_9COXI|nr:2,3,4,5-tetrahydropyridine-2,6-dicarboxylate N-succinyltransferase [Rickettsiella grylli]EDP46504.1 2,3,4,5-tetrahydropyridine-2,6-dicarboxylate N-succinyltransferase [Rickettsiella grylli]